VVVDDTNLVRVAIGPTEDYAPLLVDSGAVETSQAASQRLEAVSQR
jgi:hypothetical protein